MNGWRSGIADDPRQHTLPKEGAVAGNALLLSFALMLAAASPAFPQQAPPSSEMAKHVEALVNAAAVLLIQKASSFRRLRKAVFGSRPTCSYMI